MAKTLVACFLLLNTLFAFAGNSLTANVKVGSRQFVIKLPANPTTGYQWKATQYDTSLFRLEGSQYVAPHVERFGAGGEMVFTFTLLKRNKYPATSLMRFNYARGWETNGGDMTEVTVNFK